MGFQMFDKFPVKKKLQGDSYKKYIGKSKLHESLNGESQI